MHSDMNTDDKIKFFSMIDEEILVTVAGQIPPQRQAAKILSAGEHLWSVTDEATEAMNESNFYLCVTKDSLHFCILNSYNPDIIRKRVTIPLEGTEVKFLKDGLVSYKVTLKNDSNDVVLIIPKTRGITRLRDQKESSLKFREWVESLA